MDAAKTAVKNILHKDGKHDTTVHEKVAPAVQNETVTRTQEDHIQTAIEKETHQDHYHTTVQPVKDTEVLPEKHHHKVAPVEERTFEHDDASRVKANLDAEAAKFRSTSERVDGKHETIAEPVVAGEHVHHHVHETIQVCSSYPIPDDPLLPLTLLLSPWCKNKPSSPTLSTRLSPSMKSTTMPLSTTPPLPSPP
jgi:hypothetical protein